MFFERCEAAPDLAPGVLRALRFSLNTPVVRAADLPVAPARAALALYEPAPGSFRVVVAVRSLKTGHLLYFEPQEVFGPEDEVLDASMAFGEGMGFLFDDDELACGGAERAFGMWTELMGERATPSLPPAEPVVEVEAEEGPEELLLVEALEDEVETPAPTASPLEITQPLAPPDTSMLAALVETALDADTEVGEQAQPESPVEVVAQPAAPQLTKFRSATATPADAHPSEPDLAGDPDLPDSRDRPDDRDLPDEREDSPRTARRVRRRGRAALGRLRLVKKRRLASDEGRQALLVRILSAF